MTYQRVVGSCLLRSHCPDLDSLVQRSTSEHGGVLGVDSHLHDVVLVVVVAIDLCPLLVPIKELDRLIIRTRQHVRQLRMHCDRPDKVSMLLNDLQFLTGVVVEHAQFSIVCAHYDPLLASDELGAAHRSIRYFEGTNLSLLIVVEDGHIASI